MKKISVVHFSHTVDSNDLDKCISDIINTDCPEGYHFKQLIISELTNDTFVDFYSESGIIVYEED